MDKVDLAAITTALLLSCFIAVLFISLFFKFGI